MNLSGLRAAVRTRIGVPDTDALFTDAVVNALVNAALQRISTEGDWPWLEDAEVLTTANGDGDYAVPADWIRTVNVLDASGLPLRRSPIEDLDFIGGSGQPRLWGIFGDQIILRPIPTTVQSFTHRYIKTEPELTVDADTPLMPVPYHYAIVALAAYFAFRRSSDLQEAGAAKAEYDDWRASMHAQLDRFAETHGGALATEEA